VNITEQERAGVQVFMMEGRIDTQGASEMEETLQAATQAGHHRMVLDMTEVRYISSAGLRVLADVLTKNRDHGGDLKLFGLNPKVLRVFQIIGFDNFFSMYNSLEEAIESF